MSDTVQLNARIQRELDEQLDQLVARTGRKKVWHLTEAIRAYIAHESQFIVGVERGLADAAADRVRPFEDYAADLKQRLTDRLD